MKTGTQLPLLCVCVLLPLVTFRAPKNLVCVCLCVCVCVALGLYRQCNEVTIQKPLLEHIYLLEHIGTFREPSEIEPLVEHIARETSCRS